MEPPSTKPTTLHSFRFDDFGTIELGWGTSSDRNPGQEAGVFQIRFVPGIPTPAKGDRQNAAFPTSAVERLFGKAGDLTDRLVSILRRAYRSQACLDAGYGRVECDQPLNDFVMD